MAHPLAQGGVFLAINSALIGLLGIVYWIEAAHLFGPATVGRNSALISAMSALSGLAQLNYARALSGLVPRAGHRSARVVVRSYALTGGLSIVGGAVFLLCAPHVSARLAYLGSAGLLTTMFVVSTALWSVFTLEDAVLASARSTPVIVIENASYALVKLLLLYAFAEVGVGQFSIFLSWVVPLIAVVVIVNWYVFRRALPRMATIEVELTEVSRSWVRYDLAGYVFWLLGTLPLPVIVLGELGGAAAAVFYVPITIVWAIDLLSLNLGNALTAEAARTAGALRGPGRAFVKRVLVLVAAISALLLALAPQLLTVFGARYRTHGLATFRLLIAACVFRSCMFLGIAVARAQGRGRRILAIQAFASIGTLGVGVPLLPAVGVHGIAIGWLSASAVAAAIALQGLLPEFRRSGRAHVGFAPEPAGWGPADSALRGVCATGTEIEKEEPGVNERTSVVICTFSSQRLDQTVACVESVLAQRTRPAQVLVVVDHNDELREMLRARLPETVEIIANVGPPGLASARNAAVQASRGDLIVFIDDDAVAHERWLEALLAAFEDPDVIGAGGHALPRWEDDQPAWFPDEFLWVVGCSYRGLPSAGIVRNPLGCNMAFRADVFERVGTFDPGMGRVGSHPVGCEETEFCIRAVRTLPAAKLILVSGAEVEHTVPRERGRPAYLLRRCFYEGISKALVRRLGDPRSLDTERQYVRGVLATRLRSSGRGLVTGPERMASLGKIGATLGGLIAAAAGYTFGTAAFAKPSTAPHSLSARSATAHTSRDGTTAGKVQAD
jgi:GT2 family glycosyltransferase/O-antigen/teichoic acid export membrane protein